MESPLIILKVNINRFADAERIVAIVTEKFGRMDVLGNNADNFYPRFLKCEDYKDAWSIITTALQTLPH